MSEGKRKRTARSPSGRGRLEGPSSASGVSSAPTSAPTYAGEERRLRIEEAAYFKAKGRGFVPGFEMHDWLEAEKELDAALSTLSTE